MNWEKQFHWKGLHISIRSTNPVMALGASFYYKPNTSEMFRSPREIRLTLHVLFINVSILLTKR